MKQIFHANFNLNKDSGLLLLSNSTQLLDSISFFNQTTNISFGRYPNGTGSFIPMNTSFGYINNNDPLSVIQVEQPSHPVLLYYPNPSDATLYLTFEGVRDISITDLTGRVLYHKTHTTSFSVATADWHEGIYILHAGKQNAKLLIRHSN